MPPASVSQRQSQRQQARKQQLEQHQQPQAQARQHSQWDDLGLSFEDIAEAISGTSSETDSQDRVVPPGVIPEFAQLFEPGSPATTATTKFGEYEDQHKSSGAVRKPRMISASKKEKNRLAAQRHRQMVKESQDRSKHRLAELDARNKELKELVAQVSLEVQRIKALMLQVIVWDA
jgi:hypothetical protein